MAWYVTLPVVLAALWIVTMLIYWFNLENKFIYYVIRPILNRTYDRQKTDVRL